jgi:hypothetical protein
VRVLLVCVLSVYSCGRSLNVRAEAHGGHVRVSFACVCMCECVCVCVCVECI